MRRHPRHHRPLGVLPLGLLAVVVAASTAFAQPAGVPAVVEHLLQDLASDSCARRWAAIEEYVDRIFGSVSKYGEPAQEVTARLRERVQSAAPLLAARTFGWSRPVRRLLESKEPMARLVGSSQAARGNLLRDQAPSNGHVVPELMRGLDADSFAAHYDSAQTMLAINGIAAGSFCVDPSDAPADRADGVRAWRSWWDQNKASMAGDWIPQ